MSIPHTFQLIASIMGSNVVGVPLPRITGISSPANVSEGSSASFTITTANIPNSTQLTWGVGFNGSTVQADFGAISGSVTVNNNTGSFSVPIALDGATEGNETFTVTVGGQVSGTTVSRTSSVVTINNTVATVTAPEGTFNAQSSGLDARARITFQISTDGNWYMYDQSTGSGSSNFTSGLQGAWLISGLSSNYDVRIDWSGAEEPLGQNSVWRNLGLNANWIFTAQEESLGWDGTVQIRDANTLQVLDTGILIIGVQHFP